MEDLTVSELMNKSRPAICYITSICYTRQRLSYALRFISTSIVVFLDLGITILDNSPYLSYSSFNLGFAQQ